MEYDFYSAIDEMVDDGRKEGIEQGLKATIQICKNLGVSIETVIEQLMLTNNFTKDTAREYAQKYWS